MTHRHFRWGTTERSPVPSAAVCLCACVPMRNQLESSARAKKEQAAEAERKLAQAKARLAAKALGGRSVSSRVMVDGGQASAGVDGALPSSGAGVGAQQQQQQAQLQQQQQQQQQQSGGVRPKKAHSYSELLPCGSGAAAVKAMTRMSSGNLPEDGDAVTSAPKPLDASRAPGNDACGADTTRVCWGW